MYRHAGGSKFRTRRMREVGIRETLIGVPGRRNGFQSIYQRAMMAENRYCGGREQSDDGREPDDPISNVK